MVVNLGLLLGSKHLFQNRVLWKIFGCKKDEISMSFSLSDY
jgi:hypothetical protein